MAQLFPNANYIQNEISFGTAPNLKCSAAMNDKSQICNGRILDIYTYLSALLLEIVSRPRCAQKSSRHGDKNLIRILQRAVILS